MTKEPFAGAGDQGFRALLDAAPDAMLVVDDAGTIALVNAQAETMFGFTRDELIGQPVELLVPERYHASHERDRAAYARAPRPRPMGNKLDLYARRRDGSEFPVEISLSPLRTATGTFVVSAIRDISQRRAAEAERERLIQERAAHAEANRVRDEFIATLSHELRTPLNAILGWATILEGHILPPEKTDQALKTIIRNARAQARLVEDLLDVSRIVAGKMSIRPRPMDFVAVVESAVDVVRPAAAAKRLQLELRVDVRPIFLDGDPYRLQQVVWNLLSNAVKFSDRDGHIDVQVAQADGAAKLIVRDTGRGIDAKFLPHVFDRFRQGDSSDAREHDGLGLGLALVKAIVELHGGSVEAASSGPGFGAVFRVRLPCGVARPATPTPEMAGLSRRLDAARVLVVDDQPDERELLETVLSAHGAAVRTAGSVDEAVEVLAAHQPSVLVTDLAMPGSDGYRLLQRVRAIPRFGQLRVVAVTAHARVEDRDRAETAGFDAYLSKPVDPERLVLVVASLASTST